MAILDISYTYLVYLSSELPNYIIFEHSLQLEDTVNSLYVYSGDKNFISISLNFLNAYLRKTNQNSGSHTQARY